MQTRKITVSEAKDNKIAADDKSLQEEMIPVPSEAVQACFKIIGLFRAARACLLALYEEDDGSR
jgi:hypothetical protein